MLRSPHRFLMPSLKGEAMRLASQLAPPYRSCKILLQAACLTLLFAATASGQKSQANAASLPKYDFHTEAKMKGIVEELKLPPKGSEKEAAHLLVKSGTDSVDVYLCPKSFFDDMGMGFTKGDEIALTGSKIKQGELDLILVREVVKGNDTFVLRDAKGDPVWNWHR
jgi:hypothetical protein